MRHLPAVDRFKRYGRWSGSGKFISIGIDQSIGIDDTNTFQLKFFI